MTRQPRSIFVVTVFAAATLGACQAVWGFDDLRAGSSQPADANATPLHEAGLGRLDSGTVDSSSDGGNSCETSNGCTLPPSCAAGLTCNGESCCAALTVPTGSFQMGRGTTGPDAFDASTANEVPEHTATVQAFRLDKYEVTVGRFREFANHYQGAPAENAGAYSNIAGSGWQSEWNASLPSSAADLIVNVKCGGTWTDAPGANETLPMDCLSWFESFAFCAWDGGRLPTEAEWEYAAAGPDNRLYPWGSSVPDNTRASFFESGETIRAVGFYDAGGGPFGHLDLAGNLWERVLDYGVDDATSESFYDQPCADCANLGEPPNRMMRGGAYNTDGDDLRSARRFALPPDYRSGWVGVRCARL